MSQNLPVKAVIIYDEDPEATELINMSTDGSYLTSAFITGKDGAAWWRPPRPP